MKNLIAYKFVTWDIRPLEELNFTLPYRAKVKLLNGEKLTRAEKDMLVSSMFYNFGVIKMGGWAFDFRPYLKTYLVKQYDRWTEYKAFDKTSLKTILSGTIQRIVEVD
jgi:hypothetical protein